MLNRVCGEQVAQAAVVDVGEGVVGLQALRGDAVAGEVLERALDERGDGLGALVGVQFGVDQPRVSSMIEWQNSQPTRAFFSALVVVRSPVTLCPGRENRARRLVSICSRSPGQGHSNRRTCSRAGRGAREIPRRAKHRLTVACAIPSSPAIKRGPHPIRSRA